MALALTTSWLIGCDAFADREEFDLRPPTTQPPEREVTPLPPLLVDPQPQPDDTPPQPPTPPSGDPGPTWLPTGWDPVEDCNVQRVRIGAYHWCAITRGGHVMCWGLNTTRQLGFEGGVDVCNFGEPCRHAPAPVEGIEDVVALSLGAGHSCALTGDGAVYCWGSDQGGTLGVRVDGTCAGALPCTETPTPVPGVTAIDIDSWGGTCAARRAGGVTCWGHAAREPTTISMLPNEVLQVADGCALDVHGVAYCWGADHVAVPLDFAGDVLTMTKGYNHVCLVDAETRLHCWGLDNPSALGPAVCLGCTPTPVAGVDGVAQIAGSTDRSWLLKTDGSVHAMGGGGSLTPVALPGPAVQVEAGYFSACAVLEDGSLVCWEDGLHGIPYGIALCDGLDEPPEQF